LPLKYTIVGGTFLLVLMSVVSFVFVFNPSSVLKYFVSFVIPAIICCLFLFGCNICFSVIYLDTTSFALAVLWSDWLSSMSVILFPSFVLSKPRCSLSSRLCCRFGICSHWCVFSSSVLYLAPCLFLGISFCFPLVVFLRCVDGL